MTQIRIYTTPTLTFRVKGVDITAEDHIYVTFADHTESRVLTKADGELTVSLNDEDTDVSVTLSQAETKIFRPNTHASAEINWCNSSGTSRGATEIVDIIIKNNLLKEIKPDV